MISLQTSKIKKKINFVRKQKKKIVLCHGVFDLIHLGHIYHFKTAKSFGDYLIVSITSNKYIKKGPGRPLFDDLQRITFLKELKVIDEVILSNKSSAEDVIRIVKPDFYVKGPDYKNNKLDKTKKISIEKKLVEKFGGKIKYTDDITYSSSRIINQSNFILNEYQSKFLSEIKRKYSYSDLLSTIKKFKNLRVLIIGELIIDKYTFGDIVGKSSKEPHLVSNESEQEFYIGGSGAIARHLSTFVKKIDLISPFGNETFYKKLIQKEFGKNFNHHFIKPDKNFRTIEKERFIDRVSGYKLFGSYILPKSKSAISEKFVIDKIKHLIPKVDVIIISDYGHHFLSKNVARVIINSKKFVSVNAQINSSTHGYNNIKKYTNANAVIINETELRQELRDNIADLKYLSKKFKKRKKYKRTDNYIRKKWSDAYR